MPTVLPPPAPTGAEDTKPAPEPTPAGNWFVRNRVLVITLVTCLVVGLVAGLISWNLHNRTPQPQEALKSSTTYEMVSTVLAQETAQEPASIMLAPATEDWWKFIAEKNMNLQVRDLDFNNLSRKAVYLAYTISSGEKFTGHLMMGLPTTFVVYETTDDAVAVSEQLNANGISNFVRGNMLLLLSPGVHTDVDYSLDQFIRSEQVITAEDVNLGDQAVLMMNFSEFQNIYPQNWDEDDRAVFQKAFATMGVQPEGSGWTGTSTDGKTWQGNLYGFVPQSELLTDPTALHTVLDKTAQYVLPDGTIATEPPEEFSGVINPQQAAAGNYFDVATQEGTSVGTFNAETGTLSDVKSLSERGSSDVLEVTVDVNEWLGFMEGNSSAAQLLPVERAIFTLHSLDGRSTLKFVDGPESTNPIDPYSTETPQPTEEDGE